MTFVDFDICHQMASIQKLYFMTYLFMGQILNVDISEMVTASAKMYGSLL